MSKENAEVIKEYDIDAISQTIGKAARIKHLSILLKLAKRFDNKPWEDYTSKDIKEFIAEVMMRYSSKGDETHTTADHKKVIKIFFRWKYYGNRSSRVTYKNFKMSDAPITDDIKIVKVRNKLAREDLLTADEKSRILHACDPNLRNKAIFAVKFEAGDRAGEFLTAQIKHVKSDEFGAVIHVDGKTGARPIRIIENAPHLFKWLNAHPFRDNGDAPICMDMGKENYGQPMKYAAANRMLKKVCKKAGIEKRIYFTLMRHTQITESSNYLTEAQQKKRYGWTPGSDMPQTYVHLVDADVDDALLKHHGLKKEKSQEEKRLPKICAICKNPNAWDDKICDSCGKPLNLESAMELDEENKKEHKKLVADVAKDVIKHFKDLGDCPLPDVNKVNKANTEPI